MRVNPIPRTFQDLVNVGAQYAAAGFAALGGGSISMEAWLRTWYPNASPQAVLRLVSLVTDQQLTVSQARRARGFQLLDVPLSQAVPTGTAGYRYFLRIEFLNPQGITRDMMVEVASSDPMSKVKVYAAARSAAKSGYFTYWGREIRYQNVSDLVGNPVLIYMERTI